MDAKFVCTNAGPRRQQGRTQKPIEIGVPSIDLKSRNQTMPFRKAASSPHIVRSSMRAEASASVEAPSQAMQ